MFSSTPGSRRLFLCVLTIILCSTSSALLAADLAREKEARVLMAEAETYNAASNPYRALQVFEKVRDDYSETNEAQFAVLRLAETKLMLGDAGEAIAPVRGRDLEVFQIWIPCLAKQVLSVHALRGMGFAKARIMP